MSVLQEQKQQFDLTFIDANKSNYPAFLEKSLALSKPGTIIAADNTLNREKVIDYNDKSENTEAIGTFNQMVSSDSRLESAFFPGIDGFVIAKVKEK